jgi:hypothetical protein
MLFAPMKLPLLTPALVAVLGLALAGTSLHAQTNAAPAAPDSTAASDTTAAAPAAKAKSMFGGTVTAVDAAGMTLSVHSKKHDVVVKITPKTKFKNATSLTDIAVGDKVMGAYKTDASGALMATVVNKKMPKADAAATAPAAQ